MEDNKQIYIGHTRTMWQGKNGEVNIETDDGTFITWNARSLYDDLPSIIALTHLELEEEQKHTNEKWNALGKKLVRDYKIKK